MGADESVFLAQPAQEAFEEKTMLRDSEGGMDACFMKHYQVNGSRF